VTDSRACPDELELCELARGTISEERGAILRDHIGECRACRLAVADLSSTPAKGDPHEAKDAVESSRYELRRLLATGGMGEVFLGLDKVLGREVAIKLLHEDSTSPDSLARSRRRVLREAQALASFAHPNVVAVYDLGVLDGRAFLAMEYVRGRTLRQWIAEETPALERVIDALVQAGRGLVAAHEIGLVHRDFKPDNVLVGDDGRTRVTDFGLACVARLGSPEPGEPVDRAPALTVTVDGAISGTPAYMAPEQLAGASADARSDQYAFSVTLYEALHGKRPAAGLAPSPPAVKTTSRLRRVETAILRGLSLDPNDRFGSMRELLAEIETPAITRPGGGHRAVLFGVAASLLGLTIGTWLVVHRGTAPSSVSPSGLHSPCGGQARGECPAPLVCRYPDGDPCGASGAPGSCVWPLDGCDAKSSAVCGCDGVNYENSCEANRRGWPIAYRGACVPWRVSPGTTSHGLAFGAPDEQEVDGAPLIRLASFIEAEKLPIFSLLVSRNGVLFFELYTSKLTREHAHYVMGVTGTFTSALMGAAIDRHIVGGPETSVADALPADVFPSPAARDRFRAVTIRDVLGMSALDAPIPPHDRSEASQERQREFLASPNRATFAVSQAVLPEPGTSFQFTDITSLIATGILEYRTKKTALEFAEETLFGPMDFRNYEWMHQDKVGIDNGAYGLRLRAVDMQKLGILYLSQGLWEGKRLLSSDWVLRSFSPCIKSSEGLAEPNYGWHWLTIDYGNGTPYSQTSPRPRWVAHIAQGWKGQRIAVFPSQGVVVTMTGILEPPEDEAAIFRRIVRDYVMPAVDGTGAVPAHPDASLRAPLASLLERIRTEPLPLKRTPEPRMVPSIEPKEHHHGFQPN
jgi:CubicO group peptidase (beta-lactamase class C family)/predicted Ser/Thr protein kinase